MLRVGWQFVWEQIFSGVLAAGYDDLNPAHISAFRYPTLDRQRPTELADQLQITKQSVNDLLGHLEQRGYLTREPDPTDGRARVIRLTAKGRRLEKTVNSGPTPRRARSPSCSGRASSHTSSTRSKTSSRSSLPKPRAAERCLDSVREGSARGFGSELGTSR